MDEYRVRLTLHARQSIVEISNYIADELLNPSAAIDHVEKFYSEIRKLSDHPEKYKLIDEQPWRKEGIRKIRVKNYYIYYWISEREHVVYVTDVIYAASDQSRWLDKMPLN